MKFNELWINPKHNHTQKNYYTSSKVNIIDQDQTISERNKTISPIIATSPKLPTIRHYATKERPKTPCRSRYCGLCIISLQPCSKASNHYVLVQLEKHIELLKT